MSVGINRDYFKLMYNFHRRINKKEKIVGWYTTTTAEGKFNMGLNVYI
jgi:hypothetical protein